MFLVQFEILITEIFMWDEAITFCSVVLIKVKDFYCDITHIELLSHKLTQLKAV